MPAGSGTLRRTSKASALSGWECLRLIGGDRTQLVAALKYLVATHSYNDSVSTFLSAVLQADRVGEFVDSLENEREFLDCLESDPVRKVLLSDIRDDPRVVKWAKSALAALSDASFDVVAAISTLSHSGRRFPEARSGQILRNR
jgi:hypothetical protein